MLKQFTDDSGKAVNLVWAYPVGQAVYGGDPTVLYFGSPDARNAYMTSHGHCEKLPRCKAYTNMITA